MPDRYAVVGNPISHSKSPLIHEQFARQTGEDISYGAILAPLGGFEQAVRAFRAGGGKGLNVTVPFKLEAFQLASRLTERAKHAQAVNTLKFDGPDILGDNTDGAGLLQDIQGNLGFPASGKRVLLMGAGGAARGVLGPVLDTGPASVVIANRTPERATDLAALFEDCGQVIGSDYQSLKGQQFDLVINATSASLQGKLPLLPSRIFSSGALAYDMMYGRGLTPFLSFAREQGVSRLADGLGMLVEQAAESFYLWRGIRPDTAPVIANLRDA